MCLFVDPTSRSRMSPRRRHRAAQKVTEARVLKVFAHRRPSGVKRYVLPRLCAMNFVIDDVLDGGVNRSLNLDSHGKTLAFLLLDLQIAVPADLTDVLAMCNAYRQGAG